MKYSEISKLVISEDGDAGVGDSVTTSSNIATVITPLGSIPITNKKKKKEKVAVIRRL